MRYVYSWIRFVPNPANGEFVNLGAIVGSDSPRDWKVRIFENRERGNFIDPKRMLPLLFVSIEEVVFSPLVLENITEEALNAYASVWNNVLQLSPPGLIDVESTEAGLDLLWKIQTGEL